MQRVFADIEDRELGIWGFECPYCKTYLTEVKPRHGSMQARCAECDSAILVTFFDEMIVKC